MLYLTAPLAFKPPARSFSDVCDNIRYFRYNTLVKIYIKQHLNKCFNYFDTLALLVHKWSKFDN